VSPATKTRSKTSEPIDMAAAIDRAADREIREHLDTYRGLVRRAAGGEQLSALDADLAAAALREIGLPAMAWQRDVDAVRQFDQFGTEEQQLAATEKADGERCHAITAEIKTLEQQIATLRAEHSQLSGRPLRRVAALQRQAELRSVHPQALADIDTAVRLRRKALENPSQPQRHEMPGTGWLS